MKAWLQNHANRFSFVGLSVAHLFFAASVTPSLLPRHYATQGLMSGLALAAGYGVGVLSVLAYKFFELPEPTGKTQLYSKRTISVTVAITFVVCLRSMTFWQNSIRTLMDMSELESAYPIRTALIAIVFGFLLVVTGRFLITLLTIVYVRLAQFLPRRVAATLSGLVIGFGILFLVNGVVGRGLLVVADAISLKADEWIRETDAQPEHEVACGSQESLVAWNSLGRMGKDFLLDGPTRENISSFWGSDAKRPLRVFVGMRSRSTQRERAALALEELKRAGAFDRKLLVVATPTGTGWLDPSAVDTLEYLHAGDTAIVATQYSYLPSWITILVDSQRSIRSARVLFDTIYDYWTTLPKDNRPELYLHGLSLGALGSEVSASLYTVYEDPIQGAVWSGPPFPSTQWNAICQSRDDGSSAWLPKFDGGRFVRFTAQENSLRDGHKRSWGPIRNVYIQYASDPMVFFSLDLWRRRPDWLTDGHGPDVSDELRWYPIITSLQVAFDLPMATSVPLGYGHNYSPKSYLDAWIDVTQPENWKEEQNQKLLDAVSTPSRKP